jgi:galactokinase/mevalonate kinase-like predicted kinase
VVTLLFEPKIEESTEVLTEQTEANTDEDLNLAKLETEQLLRRWYPDLSEEQLSKIFQIVTKDWE